MRNGRPRPVGPAGRMAAMIAICLLLSFTMEGCRILSSPLDYVYVDMASPVWLSDGWVYLMHRNSSDAPFEVWRQHPDGSGRAVLRLPRVSGCAEPLVQSLFHAPNGHLGVQVGCSGDDINSRLLEYLDAATYRQLGDVAYVSNAWWTADPDLGYVEQSTKSCLGIAPVRRGAIARFPGAIEVDGRTWWIEPEGSSYDCSGMGLAKSPVTNSDGSALIFLASSGRTKSPSLPRNDATIPWSLCLWNRGSSAPTVVGGGLKGADRVRLLPNGKEAIVSTWGKSSGELVSVNLKSGASRNVAAGIKAADFDVAPDGHSLFVLMASGNTKVVMID